MTRLMKYVFVLLVLVLTSANVSSAADCGVSQALQVHLTRLRGMLVAIVGAMPESKYDFKPTPEVRSFREMTVHMISDVYTHMGYVAGKSKEESDKLVAQKYGDFKGLKTREELLKALNEAYDYGDKVLANLSDQSIMGDTVSAMRGAKVTRFEAAMQAYEDQMDHYGNYVVYLRLNGIVPPDTAERQKQLKMQKDHPADHDGMGM